LAARAGGSIKNINNSFALRGAEQKRRANFLRALARSRADEYFIVNQSASGASMNYPRRTPATR
jgi:hypothetical protein